MTRASATPRCSPGRGTGAQVRKPGGDAAYVAPRRSTFPASAYPNAYPGATAGYAKERRFDSAGNVTGGFGVENVITNDSHSTYHRCKRRCPAPWGTAVRNPAGYTWSKSIDDTSMVSVVPGRPARCFGFFAESSRHASGKGPSNFDTTHGFSLSVAQDLHLASTA